MRTFERFVAIGDSTVEGLDDPDGRGGYRGWSDRIAQLLADRQGSVLYANLGIRGRTTRQIREEQLAPAVAMRPDLAACVSGTNDLLRRRFDPGALRDDVEAMQRALRDAGATVFTFTLPDLSAVMPLARMLRSRLLVMNDVIRDVSRNTGTIVCDFAAIPVASDARLWSDDRLHANTLGHARMAVALAQHAGIIDDTSWREPLPGQPPRGMRAALGAEAKWMRHYLAPWIWRHLHGRSSGDGVTAKRPQLTRIEGAAR